MSAASFSLLHAALFRLLAGLSAAARVVWAPIRALLFGPPRSGAGEADADEHAGEDATPRRRFIDFDDAESAKSARTRPGVRAYGGARKAEYSGGSWPLLDRELVLNLFFACGATEVPFRTLREADREGAVRAFELFTGDLGITASPSALSEEDRARIRTAVPILIDVDCIRARHPKMNDGVILEALRTGDGTAERLADEMEQCAALLEGMGEGAKLAGHRHLEEQLRPELWDSWPKYVEDLDDLWSTHREWIVRNQDAAVLEERIGVLRAWFASVPRTPANVAMLDTAKVITGEGRLLLEALRDDSGADAERILRDLRSCADDLQNLARELGFGGDGAEPGGHGSDAEAEAVRSAAAGFELRPDEVLRLGLYGLKAKYRYLAKEKHPDVNPHRKDATREFQELTNAFLCLRRYIEENRR